VPKAIFMVRAVVAPALRETFDRGKPTRICAASDPYPQLREGRA